VTRRIILVTAAVAVVAAGGLLVLRSDSSATDAAAPTTTAVVTTMVTTTLPPAATTTTSSPPTTTTTSLPPPVEIPDRVILGDAPPQPEIPDGWDGNGVVTVAAGGADVASAPGNEPFVRMREGLVVAGRGMSIDREWVRIFHMCDGVAWVRAGEIAAMSPAPDAVVGAGFDFANAVIVVDAGHGGPANTGASGGGLSEKVVNAEIAARLVEMLRRPNTVNWETGEILAGDAIPAAAAVIRTRVGDGEAADYEAGLDFRAAVANEANAHAMVSIHNNAGSEISLDIPGSDVYYQSQAPIQDPSRRLATLLVEEFRRGFDDFGDEWVGAVVLGAKSRISPRDGVSQYYGILKASRVPTVIAEGAYLSNPAEAALLATPEFQHAYAAAVYRALVRFVATDEPGGAPSHDPEVWEGFSGRGGARPVCEIPAQP
jgi:N-acetylmuramoyl-L-alanine amidase